MSPDGTLGVIGTKKGERNGTEAVIFWRTYQSSDPDERGMSGVIQSFRKRSEDAAALGLVD